MRSVQNHVVTVWSFNISSIWLHAHCTTLTENVFADYIMDWLFVRLFVYLVGRTVGLSLGWLVVCCVWTRDHTNTCTLERVLARTRWIFESRWLYQVMGNFCRICTKYTTERLNGCSTCFRQWIHFERNKPSIFSCLLQSHCHRLHPRLCLSFALHIPMTYFRMR